MNLKSPTTSTSLSTDAADRLEHAIKYMITSLLDDGLVEKQTVVSLLNNVIRTVENTNTE